MNQTIISKMIGGGLSLPLVAGESIFKPSVPIKSQGGGKSFYMPLINLLGNPFFPVKPSPFVASAEIKSKDSGKSVRIHFIDLPANPSFNGFPLLK